MINSVNGDGFDQLLEQSLDVDLFHDVQYFGDQLAGDGFNQLLEQLPDVDPYHVLRYGGDQHAATNSIHNLQQLNSEQQTHTESERLFLDLQKTAADKGFDIDNNRASGESVLDILSQQLRRVKGIKNSHEQIRQGLVPFLQNFPNRLHDGTLNDQEILHAAANCYKACIRVINSHGSDVMISPNDPGVVNTNPLVVGLIHEKHYASLRLKRGMGEYRKNVYLLTKKEATTLTLPEIKGLRKTQQYQRGVTFFENMKDDDVRILLENQFSPILSNKRFSCATREGQANNQYNFDNERRVWDGRTIKRKVKGGSALYLILEDEVSLTQAPQSATTVTSMNTTNSTENAVETTTQREQDMNTNIPGLHLASNPVSPARRTPSSLQENAAERWTELKQNMLTNNPDALDDIISSLDPSDTGFENLLSPIGFGAVETISEASSLTNGSQEHNQLQNQIPSTSTDTCQSDYSAFSSSGETVSQNGIFSAHGTTQRGRVTKPIRAMGKDCLPSDKRDSSRQSDSGISSEANAQVPNPPISLRIQKATMEPTEGPLQGGGLFQAEIEEELPPSVKTGWAIFGKRSVKVRVSRDGLALSGKGIPRGDAPGPVTVTFTTLNGECVAKGTYTYRETEIPTTRQSTRTKRAFDEFDESLKRLKREFGLCDESDECTAEGNHETGGDAPGPITVTFTTLNGECVAKETHTYRESENPTTWQSTRTKRAFDEFDESVKRLKREFGSCDESDECAAEGNHETSGDAPGPVTVTFTTLNVECVAKGTHTYRESENPTTWQSTRTKRAFDEFEESVKHFEREFGLCDGSDECAAEGNHETGVTQVVKAQLAEEGYLGDTETSDKEDEDSDLMDNNENEIEEDFAMNNNTLDPNVGMTESIIHECQQPKLIGSEKWRDLARMLDFSENDIDMIQAEKTNYPEECCTAVIVKWIHRMGQDATVGKLADALTKTEPKNGADILLGPINGKKAIAIEARGTIEVDNENQIILGNDSTGRSMFFVWETKTKEFHTPLEQPKLIGSEKWRDLARMSDFSENEIDMVQAEKTNCPEECCIAVIVKWIHRRGRDATFGKLADALTKIEPKNVADILLGPINGKKAIPIEAGGTIEVDNENQIILGNDSTGRSMFFVWETKTKEFHASLEEIKGFIHMIDQVMGNIPKQTKQVVVEDLICKVNQIYEDIENQQKTFSDVKSSLEMPELKGETFTMQRKSEFIDRHSRTLEEVHSKVTRMTGQACASDEFVRRQIYDFTIYNLKAVHDDLNAPVADLKSADANFTKEENEKLQILLVDQRGRERQVEQLEATRAQLFFSAEGEHRISQYSTPERRKSASIPVQLSFQEIKDYINTTDQFAGNTHKQTEQVIVEDLTCTVNQIFESIEQLQKTLADIKSSLEVSELKRETSTMQRKSEFIGRHSRTLEGVYTKVTRMTDQACAFKEFVRRQFYDFTFSNLKAAHSDLNTHIADLKSVDTNFTKEENERLQILLADERGREKQVEQLETMRTQLFSTAEEEQRISQYSTSERRKSAPSIPVRIPSANTDGVSPRKSTKIKRNKTWSLFRSWRKSSEIPAVKGSENMCNLVPIPKRLRRILDSKGRS